MRAVRGTAVSGGGSAARVVDVDSTPAVPATDAAPVRLTVAAAGICGSDLGYLAMGSTFLLGHELSGTDAQGQAWAVEAVFGCGACDACTGGHRNRCRTVHERVPGLSIDGGMAEHYAVPSNSLVRLPDGLPVADACLVEPAAVAWRAVRLGGVVPGCRVAVVGGGAVGLLAVAAAQAMGAGEVALVARRQARTRAGERLGAVPVPSVGGGHGAGVTHREHGEFDVVVDAAGTAPAIDQAVAMAAPGGTLSAAALHEQTLPLPFLPAFVKELRVVTSMAYGTDADGRRDVDQAARMLADRPEIAAALITHRFPLTDAEEAFRVAADRSTGSIKVVVEP